MKKTHLISALIALMYASDGLSQNVAKDHEAAEDIFLNIFEKQKKEFAANLENIKYKIEDLEKDIQNQKLNMYQAYAGSSLGLTSGGIILYILINKNIDFPIAVPMAKIMVLSFGLGSTGISAGLEPHIQKNISEAQVKELKKKLDRAFLNRLKFKYPPKTIPGKAETIYAKYKADTLTNLEIAEVMSHNDYSYVCALRITSNLAQSQDFYGRFHEKVKKKYGPGVADNATQMLTKMEITEEDLVEHFGDKFPEFKTILEELHSNEKNKKNIPVVVKTEEASGTH